MSRTHTRTIICPNCGSVSTSNFCSQCGQANHLHHETFLGLIAHFFAHYFHYESKFWQTLKTLWLKPGALTLAYWHGQRMRYVAPVSLYIFISTAFYLVLYLSPVQFQNALTVNFSYAVLESKTPAERTQYLNKLKAESTQSLEKYLEYKQSKVIIENPNINDFLQKKYQQSFVKFFFFMIPFMAWLLKLLFMRRKSLLFVDHAIFSLHYHSFWFTIFVFYFFVPSPLLIDIVFALMVLIGAVYMIKALRKVYQISLRRSVFYSLIIGFFYSAALSVLTLLYIAMVVITA